MADEYIKREDAEKCAEEIINHPIEDGFRDSIEILSAIHNLPAADVRPVVRGQWDADGRCSACGNRWNEYLHDDTDDWGYFDLMPPFCLNCGAQMDL